MFRCSLNERELNVWHFRNRLIYPKFKLIYMVFLNFLLQNSDTTPDLGREIDRLQIAIVKSNPKQTKTHRPLNQEKDDHLIIQNGVLNYRLQFICKQTPIPPPPPSTTTTSKNSWFLQSKKAQTTHYLLYSFAIHLSIKKVYVNRTLEKWSLRVEDLSQWNCIQFPNRRDTL